ncbi:MAG TPA: TonB family protein [Gammaproteobacteria bacterium]
MKRTTRTRASDGLRPVLGLLWALALPALAQSPDDAPPPAGAAAEEQTAGVDSLRRIRDALVAAGDFDAALAPARQLVDRLRADGDPALPHALAQLARIQAELDDFESAELNYLEAIDLISTAEGEFSITLVEPYQGLGRTYIKNRQFVEAITALEQAQHVSQRNLGLYNVSQSELLDDLTTAHLGLGDTVTAEQLQVERLENAVRRFGENDPQVIPYRYELAAYYEQSRMRGAAREQYEEVVATLEALPDGGDEALLAPLRRLMRIELVLGDTEDARTRLVEILNRRPDLPPAERARSLVALGDWAVARNDPEGARSYYADAYALLRDVPEELEAAFARPAMLDFVAPLTDVDRGTRARPYTWGTIVVGFDVTANGRPSNVRIVSAQPPGVVDDEYVRRVRETHFRPRVVDGVPVATTGVRFTHYFRYYVDPDEDDEES